MHVFETDKLITEKSRPGMDSLDQAKLVLHVEQELLTLEQWLKQYGKERLSGL